MKGPTRDGMRDFLTACGLAATFAAWTVLQMLVAGRVAAPLTVLAICGVAAAEALLASRKTLAEVMHTGRDTALRAAFGGLLCYFAAPVLVLAPRYSDAPQGTEVVLLTTAAWGAIALMAAVPLLGRAGWRERTLPALAAAVAGLAGSAGVLANWERPSSFSPFTRFVTEEWLMMAGGVAFVAGGILLARLREERAPAAGVIATCTALVVALAWALIGRAGSVALVDNAVPVVLMGLTWTLVAGLWRDMIREQGMGRAGLTLVVAPPLLTLLTFLERATGILGPVPLVWPGVIGGTLLVAAAVARGWSVTRARITGAAPAPPVPALLRRVLVIGAALAVVVALVGLATPVLTATVTAVRPSGEFSGVWTVPGLLSAGGWAALSVALLAASVAVERRTAWVASALAAIATASVPLLTSSPLRTLMPGLDPDIQQDFGTEFARIVFTPAGGSLQLIAAGGAAAVLVVALVADLAVRTADRRSHETEENAS